MKKIIYYNNYSDDIIKSKNQDYKLKDNYKYIKNNIFYNILSYLVYYIVLVIAFIYCRLILRVKYKNKNIIKEKGYFIYSNHILTIGDVLNPFLINFPRRPYIICSTSNLGIPIIGKLLVLAGAIPIPNNLSRYNDFLDCIKYRCKNHPIIIYPEAHLWPYYTGIREFNNSSFHYPVEFNKKCYTCTTTYQSNQIIIYVDGEFSINSELSRRGNIKLLHDKIYESLKNNCKLSNTNKYIYKKK